MTDLWYLHAQIPLILALQHLPGASLLGDLSWLGSEEFFLLLLPIVYLCIDRRLGARLGLLVLISDTVNVLAKLACCLPRPAWIDSRIIPLAHEASFGLPSSHAQDALAVWFLVALWWAARPNRRRYRWIALSLAAVLTFLISLSRIVLGVHFPSDVLAGWLLGAALLPLMLRYETSITVKLKEQGTMRLLAFATGFCMVPVALAYLLLMRRTLPSGMLALTWGIFTRDAMASAVQTVAAHAGALLGLTAGLVLARRGAPFVAARGVAPKVVCAVPALIGALLFWRGLALVLPAGTDPTSLVLRALRYALTTLWVAYLAPSLLLRAGLLPRAAVAQRQ